MKKLIFSVVFLLSSLSLYSQEYKPGDHELFLMPTAYTMPQGTSYITNYELFLLNYSYAITSSTHIGIFSMFPITDRFINTITLGVKQHYFNYKSIQMAAYASFTPENGGYSLGNTISIGRPENGFNISLAYVDFEDGPDSEMVYMLGYRYDTSENISLIMEYTNAKSSMDNNFRGLLSAGIRIRSTNMSIELAGMRPLESTGDLLLWPLLKGTYYFR